MCTKWRCTDKRYRPISTLVYDLERRNGGCHALFQRIG